MMKISVLNENTAGARGFLAEHGLSLLIEAGEKRYLFDTGQTDVFMRNAAVLGEDLTRLDGIILSHGHFDHCDGLEYLVNAYREKDMPLPPVYVREAAFRDKKVLRRPRLSLRSIGISWKKQMVDASVRLAAELEQIGDGMWLLGSIPYTVEFETKPDTFFIDEDGRQIPDYMEDEQLLIVETDKGLSVFAGCCHAGVINCLTHVKRSFPGRGIYSVFAGMHLMNADRDRILRTVEELEKMAPEVIMPVHCTGIEAIGKIKDVFGERCILMETGKTVELG